MFILNVIIGILIYICIAFIIGKINFKEKIKKYTLLVFSIVYNFLMGYFDTIFITIIYLYFANIPKGTGYEVPASDANMNAMFGIITLLIYLLLLLPINFYMKIKGKINIKIYIIVNILSTVLGIIEFCMFSDEAKMIF